MKRAWILIPVALILSACGGSSSKPKAAGPSLQTVQVTEKEFSITPSTISLAKPGTYSFHVMNTGALTHSFEVKGHGIDMKGSDISPGSSATVTVNLSGKGSYQAYCPIDGHRSKGMQATVTVGAAAGAPTTTAPTTAPTTTTTSTKPGY